MITGEASILPARATVSPATATAAGRAVTVWRSARSVNSALAGGPITEFTDDHSPAGSATYRHRLLDARTEVRTALAGAPPLLDQILLEEVDDRLDALVREADRWCGGHATALDHIMPVVGGLLVTFGAVEPPAASIAHQRVAAMTAWSRTAREQWKAGELPVTANAVQLATALAKHAGGMAATGSPGLRAPLAALADELACWRTSAGMQSPAGTPDTAPVAAELAEVRRLLAWTGMAPADLVGWRDLLTERLDRELDRLVDAERAGIGLRWASETTEVTDAERHAWFNGSAGALPAPTGLAGRVRWLHRAHARMRHASAATLPSGGLADTTLTVGSPQSLFTPNAVFLPAPGGAGRVLFSTATFGAGPTTRRARLFLAMMVAHEGSPGHAEQHAQACQGPYAEFLDLLHNPVAREGWAMHAERQVSTMDDEADGVSAYHTIRRLLPAAEQLTRLSLDADAAEVLRSDCARRSRSLAEEMSTPGRFGSRKPLVYAAGLVSTERAIERLATIARERGEPVGTLMESYVRLGSVVPGRAARVVAAGRAR